MNLDTTSLCLPSHFQVAISEKNYEHRFEYDIAIQELLLNGNIFIIKLICKHIFIRFIQFKK